MKNETPLMRQYRKIKEKYPDTLLLFRMGDFFETFENDAVTASKVLGITLTKRSNGAASEVPLAGFPHHALDNYLPKLVKAGFRVAVCEQLEDPKYAKGIVKRDVVEVVTPGANFSEKLLDHKSNNFLAAVYLKDNICGFSFCDVSTGEFATSEILTNNLAEQVENINPSEILIPKKDKEKIFKLLDYDPDAAFSEQKKKYLFTKVDDWVFNSDYAKEVLTNHFGTQTLKGFGIEDMNEAVIAAGCVLNYLNETQKNNLPHIKKIYNYEFSDYIILDPSTKRNLEITSSISEGGREGTLISILDRTKTAMGGRLLKKWVSRPLKKKEQIEKRLSAVNDLYENKNERKKISEELKSVADLERLLSKISTGRSVARDIVQLKISLKKIIIIKSNLIRFPSPALKAVGNSMIEINELILKLENCINENFVAGIDNYGMINKGYDNELDELKDILINGKTWIENYQSRERAKTGINSLKVDFNKVFGYYIIITKANLEKVPADYVRKQTLVNAERYITEELKVYEDKILNAEEKIEELEKRLFNDLRNYILGFADQIQVNATLAATLDTLISFAEVSEDYKYVKPVISEGNELEIIDGRHPVIERLLPPGEKFIANDTYADTADSQILILTGPNMSGKSSYLRQVGLIILLAQIGCFVPARSAKISIVDKIFTRVGASDNIAKGESTFLVEMHEAANILNNATSKSLILLDEIGRGTSTYDGISIAWAMTEYIHENPNINAKTLFATHYHELNALADMYPRIKNFRVEVKEYNDKVIFLRKITEGTADHSYGIQVAQMAGLPEKVTNRAKEILRSLEDKEYRRKTADDLQISMFESAVTELESEALKKMLSEIDIDSITPLDAMNLLKKLKDESNRK
ncbi:MAG TPA: DNA mismatch repair protein MutS [Ignavibacteria bacterium]|nr:DNA mismatch repair protein MutS [Ignavibacteria bacterium]HRJ99630.1 DNA mismatch repair protein MutS [Ignavibacteria bacterium]